MGELILRPGAGLKAFGHETFGAITTNPPAPDLGPAAAATARYAALSPKDRFIRTNAEGVKLIGDSLKEFVHHPVKSSLPALKEAAKSSIQPLIDPIGTFKQNRDVFVSRGWIEGLLQVNYNLTTAGAMATTLVGAAALPVAGIATIAGAPALAAGAMAFAGSMLAWTAGLCLASLVGNVIQFGYDEAQTLAPTKGLKVGPVEIFKPTNEAVQAQLLKFDLINVGGSLLTWLIPVFHQKLNAAGMARETARGAGLASLVRSPKAAYGGTVAVSAGMVAADTPVQQEASSGAKAGPIPERGLPSAKGPAMVRGPVQAPGASGSRAVTQSARETR